MVACVGSTPRTSTHQLTNQRSNLVALEFVETVPGQTRWQEVVDELAARPGEWAVVARDAPASTTGHLRVCYGLDARARNVKNGRAAEIYARVLLMTDND